MAFPELIALVVVGLYWSVPEILKSVFWQEHKYRYPYFYGIRLTILDSAEELRALDDALDEEGILWRDGSRLEGIGA